ncbi:MAG: hypothetical protein Q9216_006014 [Gyalolechia sp. 2 TL-2023]
MAFRIPNAPVANAFGGFPQSSRSGSDEKDVSDARYSSLLLFYCYRPIANSNVSYSDATAVGPRAEASALLQRLQPLPVSSSNQSRNDSSGNLSDMTGCFAPAPGIRTISPQDALIALGKTADVVGFYNAKHFEDSAVLANWDTTVIAVIKVGDGPDEFSSFDAASQAIVIIHYCIIQQPPRLRLGGSLEVGSLNNFRVVVQARYFAEDLPEAG